MSRPNGHGENSETGFVEAPEGAGISPITTPPPSRSDIFPEYATRANQRAKQKLPQNRSVIIAAGAIVTALLVFVAVSMPHGGQPRKASGHAVTNEKSPAETPENDHKSLFPITDSGPTDAKETLQGFVNEQDLRRTAVRSGPNSQATQSNATATLGSIPPFGDKWQAPSADSSSDLGTSDISKAEHDALEKPSLVCVSKVSTNTAALHASGGISPELGLGMPVGTRLRARLESAASTAVRAPVLATIEYSYEEAGEIIIPAGAKAVGHIREANRSGYVDLEFDSLLMPNGASIPIEATATGLDLRPLKGKVEGKNTGKNSLVRSLSGIGQAGSLFIGQGSLNQPLSESDLVRERVSSNIGETGDEEISRLAVTQQIVVTISAGVPIYVVLQQTPKANHASAQTSSGNTPIPARSNMDQLHQLLQLQQELSQSTGGTQPAQ